MDSDTRRSSVREWSRVWWRTWKSTVTPTPTCLHRPMIHWPTSDPPLHRRCRRSGNKWLVPPRALWTRNIRRRSRNGKCPHSSGPSINRRKGVHHEHSTRAVRPQQCRRVCVECSHRPLELKTPCYSNSAAFTCPAVPGRLCAHRWTRAWSPCRRQRPTTPRRMQPPAYSVRQRRRRALNDTPPRPHRCVAQCEGTMSACVCADVA